MARFYGTERWKHLRAECLRRSGGRCATPGCQYPAVVADHIIPRAKGGADSLNNLRALCFDCHGQLSHGKAHPIARGCDQAGVPHDPGHWWHQ